mgnify:CR=1 FL=1
MNCSFANFTNLTFLIVLCLSLNSCEQIIEVSLPQSSPEIVIEGYITNGAGPFLVKISQSQSYFDQSNFKGINDADVEMDQGQVKEKLTDRGGGVYSTSKIWGYPNKTYNLRVTVGENKYTASVTLPPRVPIDTVYFQKGFLDKDSLNAFVQIPDPSASENYYRIRVFRNGYFNSSDYNLVSDAHANGQTLLAPIYTNFTPGDTVVVELCNLDQSTWKYYKAVNDILQQGAGLQSPGNPASNISGGALGYFGAMGRSFFKIIVPAAL